MDHLVDGPEGTDGARRRAGRRRPRDRRGRPRARRAPRDREVRRLRVVEPTLASGASRRGRRRARRGATHRLERARRRPARATSTSSGTERTSSSTGDTELQQAVRFALFHTLQAGARTERRAIPAKGLTGPGYDGHTFWDAERFILPVLTYAAPRAAGDALRWRHSTLDLARERAAQLGLAGAVFPWRTIRGQECSSYWPAGTAAFHLAGAIADAVDPLPARDRRRGVRARGRPRAARRDGATLAFARPPRRAGQLPHRRRHRPGRVQRDRGQQRLHQPAGPAEPPRGRRRGRAPPAPRVGARCRPRGGGRLARRRPRHGHPVGRGARRPPAVRGLHEPPVLGLRRARATSSTRCSCTSRTSTSIASRS